MTKGQVTRQFIIERSASLFNTKGIAATAMSDIMEATKLSKGSLYVHFDNKDVLAADVVEYNLEQLSMKVMGAMAKHRTSKSKLFAYVDALRDAINSPVKGGCPMINFGMEADDTNLQIKKRVKTSIDTAVKRIADLIKMGIKNGEFKSSWNARASATVIFAMIEGAVMMSRVAGNNESINIVAKQVKKLITDQMV